jgi:hypothetical protein
MAATVQRFDERKSSVTEKEQFTICDGVQHIQINHFEGTWSTREPVTCDKRACLQGEALPVEQLPAEARERLGLMDRVPDGNILIFAGWSNIFREFFWNTYSAGAEVKPTLLEQGVLLSPGEQTKVKWTHHGILSDKDYLLTVGNVNGEVREVGPRVRIGP